MTRRNNRYIGRRVLAAFSTVGIVVGAETVVSPIDVSTGIEPAWANAQTNPRSSSFGIIDDDIVRINLFNATGSPITGNRFIVNLQDSQILSPS